MKSDIIESVFASESLERTDSKKHDIQKMILQNNVVILKFNRGVQMRFTSKEYSV